MNWTIRKILSLLFGIALIAFTAMKIVPVSAFTGIAGTVIGFWFKDFQQQKQEKKDVEKKK